MHPPKLDPKTADREGRTKELPYISLTALLTSRIMDFDSIKHDVTWATLKSHGVGRSLLQLDHRHRILIFYVYELDL